MSKIYMLFLSMFIAISYQQNALNTNTKKISNLLITTVTRNDLIYRVSSENEIEDYTTNIEANKYIMFSLIVLLLIGPLMMTIWFIKFIRNLCKKSKRKHHKKRLYDTSQSTDSNASWKSSSLSTINTDQSNDCNCMIRINKHKRKRHNKSYHQFNKSSKNILKKAKSFENLLKILRTKSSDKTSNSSYDNLKSKVLYFSANHLNLINVKQFLNSSSFKQHKKDSNYKASINTLTNSTIENFDDYNENYSGSIRNTDLNLFDKILVHKTHI